MKDPAVLDIVLGDPARAPFVVGLLSASGLLSLDQSVHMVDYVLSEPDMCCRPTNACMDALKEFSSGKASLKATLNNNRGKRGWIRTVWFDGKVPSAKRKAWLTPCQKNLLWCHISLLLGERCSVNDPLAHAWDVSPASVSSALN